MGIGPIHNLVNLTTSLYGNVKKDADKTKAPKDDAVESKEILYSEEPPIPQVLDFTPDYTKPGAPFVLNGRVVYTGSDGIGGSSYLRENIKIETAYLEQQFLRLPEELRNDQPYLIEIGGFINGLKKAVELNDHVSKKDYDVAIALKVQLWTSCVEMSLTEINKLLENKERARNLVEALPKERGRALDKSAGLLLQVQRTVQIVNSELPDPSQRRAVMDAVISRYMEKYPLSDAMTATNELYWIKAANHTMISSLRDKKVSDTKKIVSGTKKGLDIKADPSISANDVKYEVEKKKQELDEKVEKAEKLESFFMTVLIAKKRGIDLGYYVRALEKVGYYNLDSIESLAKEEGVDLSATEMRKGKTGLSDKLASASARARATLLDINIKQVMKGSINWPLELARRIDGRKKSYKIGHWGASKDEINRLAKTVWIEEEMKKIENEERQRFEEAVEHWSSKRLAGYPSWPQMVERLRNVETVEEYNSQIRLVIKIRDNPYLNLDTIKETMTAHWLVGNKGIDQRDKGYIGWLLKDLVETPLPIGFGKAFKYARVVARELFLPEKNYYSGKLVDPLKMPADPRKLAEFNRRNLKHVQAVFDTIKKCDGFSNDVAVLMAGIISSIVGIKCASWAKNAVLARQIAWGWAGKEGKSLLGKALIGLRSFAADLVPEATGFTLGQQGSMLTIAGFPTLEEAAGQLGENHIVFGMMRFLEVLRVPFGMRIGRGSRIFAREAAEAEAAFVEGIIPVEESLYYFGKELRAVQAVLDYHWSIAGMSYQITHFPALAEFLLHTDVILGALDIRTPLSNEERNGERGKHYATLAIIVFGIRAMRGPRLGEGIGAKAVEMTVDMAREKSAILDAKLSRLDDIVQRWKGGEDLEDILGSYDSLPYAKDIKGLARELVRLADGIEKSEIDFDGIARLLRDDMDSDLEDLNNRARRKRDELREIAKKMGIGNEDIDFLRLAREIAETIVDEKRGSTGEQN